MATEAMTLTPMKRRHAPPSVRNLRPPKLRLPATHISTFSDSRTRRTRSARQGQSGDGVHGGETQICP
jgi:hypothetical protein